MAVVKAPALSLDASGNLGGICYSKWRSLNVARSPWTGTVPNTTAQQTIQGYLTAVSQTWSGGLSEAERQSWRNVARGLVRISRGMTKYVPSGYQYFVEVNMVRARLTQPLLKTPHTGFPESGFEEVSLQWATGELKVIILIENVFKSPVTQFYVEVWRAGPFENGGRHAIAGEYRFLKFWPSLVDGDDNTVLQLKYYWYKVRWVWEFGVSGNWFERQVYTG